MAVAFRAVGFDVEMVWHKDQDLPVGVNIVGIPGGFSFGNYLRCGAIVAQSPVCQSVVAHTWCGGYVLGICNGFQVLTETGLLPGALLRNAGLKYICKTVPLKVETSASIFTDRYTTGDLIGIPIAHIDGNYFADMAKPDLLYRENRVAFTYQEIPNDSQGCIVGVLSPNRRDWR